MDAEFDPTDANAAIEAFERMTKAEAALSEVKNELSEAIQHSAGKCVYLGQLKDAREELAAMTKERDESRLLSGCFEGNSAAYWRPKLESALDDLHTMTQRFISESNDKLILKREVASLRAPVSDQEEREALDWADFISHLFKCQKNREKSKDDIRILVLARLLRQRTAALNEAHDKLGTFAEGNWVARAKEAEAKIVHLKKASAADFDAWRISEGLF